MKKKLVLINPTLSNPFPGFAPLGWGWKGVEGGVEGGRRLANCRDLRQLQNLRPSFRSFRYCGMLRALAWSTWGRRWGSFPSY